MATSVFATKVTTFALKFKDRKLLGILVFILSYILILFMVSNKILNNSKLLYQFKQSIYTLRHCTPEDYESTTICTDGCRIPLLRLDHDTNQRLLHEYGLVNTMHTCRTIPLLGSNRTHIWVKKENMHHFNLTSSSKFACCYKSFKRYFNKTNSRIGCREVKYTECQYFTEIFKVDSEFVRVNCINTSNNTTLFNSVFVFVREKEPTNKGMNLPYNILILGIDSVSRLNFHRTMPKTGRFLERLGAVQFMGYNKVGDNTFRNLVPLLMGIADEEVESKCFSGGLKTFDHCPLIWKQFQKAGFTTAFAEDEYIAGIFSWKKHGFQSSPTDYFLEPFIGVAEAVARSNKYKGKKLCMNEKYFFKILLDYIEDLTMLKRKMFGLFWECKMSHDSLFFPTVMDDAYSSFFARLNASGYLNRSIIFLISDHGIRFGHFRQSRQGFFEERLPFMFALMPPSFRENYNEAYRNLKLNRHRLTTPFDMHATLTDLVNLDNIKNDKILSRSKDSNFTRGISLFLPISDHRTCQLAGIDDHWCTCYRHLSMELDNKQAQKAILYVMTYLNGLLENYPQCANLTHVKTLEVNRLLTKIIKKRPMELIVKFQTMPGGGVFEATVVRKGSNGPWSISGSVSRLNLYGNQSDCISDAQLALYCYCVNNTDPALAKGRYINLSKKLTIV